MRREAFEKASLRTRFDRRHARREAFQKASLRTRFGFSRSCQKGVQITCPHRCLCEFMSYTTHHANTRRAPPATHTATMAIIDGNGGHHRWQPVAIMAINDGNGPSRMALVAINDGNHCHQGWHGWPPISLPSLMAMVAIIGIDGNPVAIKDGNHCHQ